MNQLFIENIRMLICSIFLIFKNNISFSSNVKFSREMQCIRMCEIKSVLAAIIWMNEARKLHLFYNGSHKDFAWVTLQMNRCHETLCLCAPKRSQWNESVSVMLISCALLFMSCRCIQYRFWNLEKYLRITLVFPSRMFDFVAHSLFHFGVRFLCEISSVTTFEFYRYSWATYSSSNNSQNYIFHFIVLKTFSKLSVKWSMNKHRT